MMECRILQTETSFDPFQTGSGCWPVKNLHELQSKLLKGGYIGVYIGTNNGLIYGLLRGIPGV